MSRMFSLSRLSRVVAAAMLAIAVAGSSAACSKDKKNPTQPGDVLEGSWDLVAVDGDELPVLVSDGTNTFELSAGTFEAEDGEYTMEWILNGQRVDILDGDYEVQSGGRIELDGGDFDGEVDGDTFTLDLGGLELEFEKD